MRALKVCLGIAGVLCLLGVIGLFIPMSALGSVAATFGLPEFPDDPMFGLVYRVMAATYVAVGVFFIILALNPKKYGILVPFSGVAGVFVGVVLALCGAKASMPLWWCAVKFLFCAVFGVLIIVFWIRGRSAGRSAES